MIRETVEIAREAKRLYPDKPVVLGGWHPSLLPDQTLGSEFVDIVVVGQGENAMLEVVRDPRQGSVRGVHDMRTGDEVASAVDKPGGPGCLVGSWAHGDRAISTVERHLGAQSLPGFRHLALHLDVGFRDEVHPAHEVELGALGKGRRAPGRQDPLDAAGDRGGGSRGLDERATAHLGGGGLPRVEIVHRRILLDWVNRGCRGGVPPSLNWASFPRRGASPGCEVETS